MIKIYVPHCSVRLFYCCLFLMSSFSRWRMNNTSDPGLIDMDIPEFSSPEVSVETTKAKKKRVNKKFPNPKFYTRLIQCLDDEEYTWMLRYVPGSYRNEFEVIFTDRKNKKLWKEADIALFVELDKYIENIFKRKRSTKKYEEAVKIRFKSNMCKCVDYKFIEKVDEKKEGKCKTVKKYKILWRPPHTTSVGESRGNNGNDKKSKGKSYRKVNKIDNRKIYKNEAVSSTLCTSKNCEKNQTIKSHLTKKCKGLKDHHEIGHLMIQGNNIKMHSENVCQEDNWDFLNFYEDDSRNAFQCNPVPNSQMEMDRNGPMDSALENLANLFLDDDMKMNENRDSKITLENVKISCPTEDFDEFCYYEMKMDENENRDSKITLENVKISCPTEDFDDFCYYELSVVDTSVYLNKPYSKIENNTLGIVAVANASNQKTNTFCENLDDYTNASGQKQIYTFFGNLDAYTKPEYDTLSQENQVLQSDPFLCSAPKGCQTFFNSLGDSDWPGTYQALKPMELNEGWEQVLETRN